MNDDGNYIDVVPSFNNITEGLICPCGSRKDKITLIALVIYSILAFYGVIRLIIDIKNLVKELW